MTFPVEPRARKPHDARVLLLDEHIAPDGRYLRMWAERDGSNVRLVDEQASTTATISIAGLDRVMARIARPLDETGELGDALELAGGYRLRRLRHHAPVDATARDYLVWEKPGAAPVAALARSVAMMLRFIALQLAQSQKSEVPET
jgi:hypothetical protein